MSEIKSTVNDQLHQLQMLMHRASFVQHANKGHRYSPQRGQGRILALLQIKPEISQKELSYLLNISKQSLAELLAKMEKSEYITREASESDKRAMTIKLTEAGKEAAAALDDESKVEAKVLEGFSDEELASLSELLERLIKEYEELFPKSDYDERRKMVKEFMASHGQEGDWPEQYHGRGRGRGRGHGHSRSGKGRVIPPGSERKVPHRGAFGGEDAMPEGDGFAPEESAE